MCPNSDRKLYEAYNSLLHLYHAQFQQLGVAARVVGGAVAAGVNNCDKWALQTDRTPSVPISLRLLWRIKSVATRLASKRASLSCVVNVACYSPTPLFARRRGKMPLNAPLQLQSRSTAARGRQNSTAAWSIRRVQIKKRRCLDGSFRSDWHSTQEDHLGWCEWLLAETSVATNIFEMVFK